MLAWVLTLSRLPIAAAFAVAVAMCAGEGRQVGTWPTVNLLLLAGLAEATDLLDGWAARRYGSASELGGLVDPLCDSLARLTMFFAMALAGWLWIAVPLVMAGRDIIVAYIRVVQARTGGATGARLSGKAKALVQGAAVLATVLLASRWVAPSNAQLWREAVGIAVIAVTAWSLADYFSAGWPALKNMAKRRPR
jgi:CDP-diacylglycerol---glycerol-3-phosphate 3-phosphatidyltransferase